jgi:pSer/pThr/pTyr-binding forkhead associated (FHA) protein
MTEDSCEDTGRQTVLTDLDDSAPRARAVVLSSSDPDATGRVFELDARWPKLVLSQHTTLAFEEDGWWVSSSETTEGTWIDRRRLSPGERVALAGGEVVAVGGWVVLFDATPVHSLEPPSRPSGLGG